MKHKWEIAYQNDDFKITTTEPSLLVRKFYKEILESGDIILDAGCGSGRNSIFLASEGYSVDAFDVADLNWTDDLGSIVKNRISFTKSSVEEFNWSSRKYKLIVSSRLIQYLNDKELRQFFENIKGSLKSDGSLLLSYNSKGGIFSKEGIDVPKYSYSIEYIESLLSNYFEKIDISAGSKVSTSVNYQGNILSYDIRASNLK